MKGYLSVSGGIIQLLIELTLHTAPSKSLETKLLLSLTDNSLQTLPTHPPSNPSLFPPNTLALSIFHSHTSLFVPLWEWTFSFHHHSFTPFCLPIHPLWGFISMRVPSILRSCQDSLEFGSCLQGQILGSLNAVPLKQKDLWIKKRNK